MNIALVNDTTLTRPFVSISLQGVTPKRLYTSERLPKAWGEDSFEEGRVGNNSLSLKGRGKTCLLMLLLVACAGSALAHNPMTSWAVARLYDDRVELEVELSA